MSMNEHTRHTESMLKLIFRGHFQTKTTIKKRSKKFLAQGSFSRMDHVFKSYVCVRAGKGACACACPLKSETSERTQFCNLMCGSEIGMLFMKRNWLVIILNDFFALAATKAAAATATATTAHIHIYIIVRIHLRTVTGSVLAWRNVNKHWNLIWLMVGLYLNPVR